MPSMTTRRAGRVRQTSELDDGPARSWPGHRRPTVTRGTCPFMPTRGPRPTCRRGLNHRFPRAGGPQRASASWCRDHRTGDPTRPPRRPEPQRRDRSDGPRTGPAVEVTPSCRDQVKPRDWRPAARRCSLSPSLAGVLEPEPPIYGRGALCPMTRTLRPTPVPPERPSDPSPPPQPPTSSGGTR